MRTERYLSFIKPLERLITKKVLQVNPTIEPLRKEPEKTVIYVYEYNPASVNCRQLHSIEDTFKYLESSGNFWIDIGGLKKQILTKYASTSAFIPLLRKTF